MTILIKGAFWRTASALDTTGLVIELEEYEIQETGGSVERR